MCLSGHDISTTEVAVACCIFAGVIKLVGFFKRFYLWNMLEKCLYPSCLLKGEIEALE